MGFLSKKKYSGKGSYTGQRMYAEGGYREKDIMNNASFVVGSKKHRTITFYKKHKKDGKDDFLNYETARYSLKKESWIG